MIFSAVPSPQRLKLPVHSKFHTKEFFSLTQTQTHSYQLIILFQLEICHVMKVKCAANGILCWVCIHPHLCVCIRKKPYKSPVAENQTKREVSFALKKGCYHFPCSLCRSVCSWKSVKKGLARCVQSGWKHDRSFHHKINCHRRMGENAFQMVAVVECLYHNTLFLHLIRHIR